MRTRRSGEAEYLVAADGTIIDLTDLGVSLVGMSDIPVEYVASQAFKQHGATYHDWRLKPRTLTFAFEQVARSRVGCWALRDALIGVLSPAVGQVIYRRVLHDGAVRQIDGWIQSGMELAQTDGKSFDAAFALECPDPTFYDPTIVTAIFTASADDALLVPFVVPDEMWIGSETAVQASLTNGGTWYAYPVITIQGPYQRIRLEHSNGAFLVLGTEAYAGQEVIVDLTPGAQAITHEGVNALDELEDGNLVDFLLEPGANIITGSGAGMTGTTQVSLIYHTRYVAL